MADCKDSVRLTVDGVLGSEEGSEPCSALTGPGSRLRLMGDLVEEFCEWKPSDCCLTTLTPSVEDPDGRLQSVLEGFISSPYEGTDSRSLKWKSLHRIHLKIKCTLLTLMRKVK